MIRDKVKSIGKECILFEKLENNAVRCLNCAHKCVLNEGPPSNPDAETDDPRASIGICSIRHNWKGSLYLFDHSRPGSICVDPIEKTPLYHFFPGVDIFTIGTVGCNFRCSFCQNWSISQSPRINLKKRKDSYLEDIEECLPENKLTPKMAVERAKKRNVRFIEYDYNEPTIWIDSYVYETAKLAKSEGIFNTLCTNGYQSLECIQLIHPYIDAVNIDLKGDQKFYSKLCGGRQKHVLRNIKVWVEVGVWVEVTTLVIPNENDSEEILTYLATELYKIDPNIPWHLSRYHRDYKFSEREEKHKHEAQTPISTLLKAYEIAKKVGLKHVYLGNYWNRKCHLTTCPKCNNELVDRGEWGHAGKMVGISSSEEDEEEGEEGEGRRMRMKDEEDETSSSSSSGPKCKRCGASIPGIWSEKNQLPLRRRRKEIPKEFFETKLKPFALNDEDEVNVKIIFGSQTGVSESYAYNLKSKGEEIISSSSYPVKKIRISVVDMEEYDEKNHLCKEDYLIIVTSTYFFGRPPTNGVRFYEYVMNSTTRLNFEDAAPKFMVIGVGSTGDKKCHSETYQVVARHIDEKLEKLGMIRFMDRVEANKKSWFRHTLMEASKNVWSNILKDQQAKI